MYNHSSHNHKLSHIKAIDHRSQKPDAVRYNARSLVSSSLVPINAGQNQKPETFFDLFLLLNENGCGDHKAMHLNILLPI